MILFISFLFGAAIGSFLNVCILRIPENKPIAVDRSRCPKCSTTLRSLDLIPLISYVLLAGKCRYCKNPISFRYFFVELLTALVFVAGAGYFDILNNTLNSLVFIAFCCVMIVIIFIDIDHYIIPDRFSIGLIIAGFALSATGFYPLGAETLYEGLTGIWYLLMLNSFLGIIAGGGIFFLIFIAANSYYSRRGIEAFGFGDVKLAAGIGAFLGWKLSLFMLFSSFLIGSLLSLPVMLFTKKKIKDQIPFAPAICIAAVLTFLIGENIVNWYLGLSRF